MKILRRVTAVIFGLVGRTYARLYKSGLVKARTLDRLVVSVGNLTTGGTGKTPFVMYLAMTLQDAGYFPAILSRGYKGSAERSNQMVTDGNSILCTPEVCGDEPYLLAQKLSGVPILVGKNRWRSAEMIQGSLPPEGVYLLDDGFQHRALKRNLDLVLFDATDSEGLRGLFPFGRLREPLSALERADAIILTRTHLSSDSGQSLSKRLHAIQTRLPIFLFRHSAKNLFELKSERKHPISALSGKPVVALAAIGNPDQFLRDLEGCGMRIAEQLIFRDHHSFAVSDLDQARKRCRELGAKAIVTTTKDAARMRQFSLEPDLFFALEIEVEPVEGNQFCDWFFEQLEARGKAGRGLGSE